MSKAVLDRLKAQYPEAIVSSHNEHGDETVVIKKEHLVQLCTYLRDDASNAFEMLTDVTAVDYLGIKEPRFEVVYHLYSVTKNHRLRLKIELNEKDPVVPSLVNLWKSANWMEREVWDLYGVKFDGHPDLRRILLYPEFVGHPLRKDYPIEQRQPRIPPRPGRTHL